MALFVAWCVIKLPAHVEDALERGYADPLGLIRCMVEDSSERHSQNAYTNGNISAAYGCVLIGTAAVFYGMGRCDSVCTV